MKFLIKFMKDNLKISNKFLYILCVKNMNDMTSKRYLATFLVYNRFTGKTSKTWQIIEAPNLLFARDEAKLICQAITEYALESVTPMDN